MRTRTRTKSSLAPARAPRSRIGAVAALAGVLVALTGPIASGATAAALASVTVTGTIENVVVDDNDAGAGVPDNGATEVETFVNVDGRLFDLPDGTVVPPAQTGQDVVITLEAAPGMSGVRALEVAADDAATTAARVVDVLPVGEPGSPEPALEPGTADAVVGAHTLTILPVYWTAPDATVGALGTLATQTADYWREQSAGRLAITTSARDWAAIPAPASCDSASLAAMFNAATAANPSVPAPSLTNHVLVYFPRYAVCSFAGRATLLGGSSWVNGSLYVDVAAHELGHNLGLGHANLTTCTSGGARVPLSGSCTTREYGDYADVMGIAMSRRSGNLNTALADYLGYANVTAIPAGSASAVTVDLAPLASVSAARGVKIQVPAGTVYVDFRPAVGRDVRMPAWAGVQVHLRTTDRWGIPTTYLLDMQPTAPTAFATPSLPSGSAWVIPDTGLTLTVTGLDSSARVRVASSGALDYVSRVYAHLFSRSPDPAGLYGWNSALQAGTPRIAVANAITSSTEYRSGLIRESYRRFLGREPEPTGLGSWLDEMGRGVTIQQMEGGFVASPEYFNQSGADNGEWVRRLYSHVLGRAADVSEVAYWVSRVDAPGVGRQGVAMGFLLSTERLTTVVDGEYQHLLGRRIDPSGRQTWVGLIQGGVRLEDVIGGIIASEEYFARG